MKEARGEWARAEGQDAQNAGVLIVVGVALPSVEVGGTKLGASMAPCWNLTGRWL